MPRLFRPVLVAGLFALLALLAGAASGQSLHATDPSTVTAHGPGTPGDAVTAANESENPSVRIVAPETNETVGQTGIIRIELAFEETDTATVTFGDREPPQSFEVHVTVRDADGDGAATLFLNPYQVGHGARTSVTNDEGENEPLGEAESCEARGIDIDECDTLVVPEDSRNHGFQTVPGSGTRLVGASGTQAVSFGPVDFGGGSSGGGVLFPQSYDLRVTSGSKSFRQAGVDDEIVVRTRPIQINELELLTAPRTGPDAVDPSNETELLNVIDNQSASGGGTRTVTDREYAIVGVNATGLEGILHEKARRDASTNATAVLTREARNLTAPFTRVLDETGLRSERGTFRRFTLLTRGTDGAVLHPTGSVESVLGTTDEQGHYETYYVVLRLVPGDAITAANTELASQTVLESTFWVTEFLRNPAHGGAPRADASGTRSASASWQFVGLDTPDPSIEGPQTVAPGEPVRLTATPPQNRTTGYEWFVDETKIGEGRTVNHTFSQVGEYQVSVQVRTNATTVTATEGIVVEMQPPSVSISVSDDEPLTDETVRFEATTNASAVDRYEWAFGDGETETGRQVSHSYDRPERYKVELRVVRGDEAYVETRSVVVSDMSRHATATPADGTGGQTATGEANAEGEGPGETPSPVTATDDTGAGFGVLVVLVAIIAGVLWGTRGGGPAE